MSSVAPYFGRTLLPFLLRYATASSLIAVTSSGWRILPTSRLPPGLLTVIPLRLRIASDPSGPLNIGTLGSVMRPATSFQVFPVILAPCDGCLPDSFGLFGRVYKNVYLKTIRKCQFCQLIVRSVQRPSLDPKTVFGFGNWRKFIERECVRKYLQEL